MPPVVTMTPYNMPESVLSLMGSPFLASLLPYGGSGLHGGQPLNFWERTRNVIKTALFKAHRAFVYRPQIDELLKEVSITWF